MGWDDLDIAGSFARGMTLGATVQESKLKKAQRQEFSKIAEAIPKGIDAATNEIKSVEGLKALSDYVSLQKNAQDLANYESPKDKRTGDLISKAVENGVDISNIDIKKPGSGNEIASAFKEKELKKQVMEVETKAAAAGVPPIIDDSIPLDQKANLYNQRIAEKANIQKGAGQNEQSISLVSALPEVNNAADTILQSLEDGSFPTDPASQAILDSGNYLLAVGNPKLQQIMSAHALLKQKTIFGDAGKALTNIELPIVSAAMKFTGKSTDIIKSDILKARNILNSKGQLYGASESQIYGTAMVQDPASGKTFRIPKSKLKDAQAMGGKVLG